MLEILRCVYYNKKKKVKVMASKRDKCINFLKKVGFLIRYNDLELYHGRCGNGEDWSIKNDFDNSSNVSRDNIMGIPCLCVASYSIAESYANGASLGGRSGKPCVYKIISKNDESLVVDEKFSVNKLSEGEVIKFYQAVRTLIGGKLKGFLAEDEVVLDEIVGSFDGWIDYETEGLLCKKLSAKCGNVDKNAVKKAVGAFNAKISLESRPVRIMSDFVFASKEKRDFFTSGGKAYSFNQEFVRYVLECNNIIGLKKKAFSSDSGNIVYIFNLNGVIADEIEKDREL